MVAARDAWSDPSELITPESLTGLGISLGITWPTWHRHLVYHLISLPSRGRSGRIYFPGGFLFDRPHYIYVGTMTFRTGGRKVFDRAQLSTALPWQHNHVIVGDFGGGLVVLDTTSNCRTLMCVESSTMTFAPFIDELPLDVDWEANRHS